MSEDKNPSPAPTKTQSNATLKLFADDKLLMEYKCLANSGCHNQYR